MNLIEVYVIGLAVILACMILLWLLSLKIRNSSIVDIFWGTGFVVAAWLYLALSPDGLPARKIIVAVLVTLWGLRLSLHILFRNAGKPEDFRYQKWREENGNKWWWVSFFQVFFLQGILLWMISAPLLAAQFLARGTRLTIIDVIAIFLWGVGFFFETAGDLQLARFKKNPSNKGKVLTTGVWRFTRHPNYFGDSAQWWAYFLFALAAGGWWTVFSPILMTILLLRVSGVALLEKTLETRPGYKEYIESTSAFIPWIPRKKSPRNNREA